MGDILKARAEPAEEEKKKIRQAINIRTYREIKILMKRLTQSCALLIKFVATIPDSLRVILLCKVFS